MPFLCPVQMPTCPLFEEPKFKELASGAGRENERTVEDFVQVCGTDKCSTHEQRKKKKEWVDSHLARLEHGQDERG